MIFSRALLTVIMMLPETLERLEAFLTGLTYEHLGWFVINVLEKLEMVILTWSGVFPNGRRQSLELLRGQDDVPGLESAEEVGLSPDGRGVPDDLD